MEPQKKGRIKAGLKKSFEISETLTFSIFAEGAWMDKWRFGDFNPLNDIGIG